MILSKILNWFFPKICVSCGKNGSYLCNYCLNYIRLLEQQNCPNCRRQNLDGSFCGNKCKADFNFDQLLVCLNYERLGLFKELMIQFKYRFSEDLAKVFGKIMTQQLANFSHSFRSCGEILLVPTPLSKNRLNYRGFNQALLLAEYLAKNFQNIRIYDCLKRKESYIHQAGLHRNERLKNIKDTIFCKNMDVIGLQDKVVILLDDVATTCSTINECAKVLKNCGAKYICGFVLARGRLFAKIRT